MSAKIRVNWLIGALALALAVLLGWAWYDGGETPLREMSAATTLPKVVQ